jgi:3-dehydrotetronate 4-kinase
MGALRSDFTIACPAFPANRRTIYQGYLFVGNVPLNESGMRHHPLTPMTDANLVRVLQAQVKRRVGLVDYGTVFQGASAINERFEALRKEGCGFAVVDALSDQDLVEIGEACASLKLVTAGSGLAVGLPGNFHRKGLLADNAVADALPVTGGLRAVIAGSCSTATQEQVARMCELHPAFQVDPVRLASGANVVTDALDWAASRITGEPVLIYATSGPEAVEAVQAKLGAQRG